MKPELVRATLFGLGTAMLVFSWSMVSGPIGTLAALGVVLLFGAVATGER